VLHSAEDEAKRLLIHSQLRKVRACFIIPVAVSEILKEPSLIFPVAFLADENRNHERCQKGRCRADIIAELAVDTFAVYFCGLV
jgi:hypothetical protein